MSGARLTGRLSDERTLLWLSMRADGLTWAEIAEATSAGRGQVQIACTAVRDADVALCGPSVAWAYEPGAARRAPPADAWTENT